MLKATRLLWIVLVFGAFMAFGNDRAEAETALASWYGPGFEGQPTASGEAYNPYGYTAAHKTMPLGTELNVSYAGRSVNVVVNDRGPYSGGRDLDLSQGAAEYLGLTSAGVDYVDYAYAGEASYAETDYAETEYTDTGYAEAEADYAVDDSSAGQAASGGSYVIQSGDTLTSVAAELGTSVDGLMAANGLTDPDVIYAGQTIVY